jgi:hypothetical protein
MALKSGPVLGLPPAAAGPLGGCCWLLKAMAQGFLNCSKGGRVFVVNCLAVAGGRLVESYHGEVLCCCFVCSHLGCLRS